MSPRAPDEPVRLTRIYTRAGDQGETSLGDGSRVSKLDCRIGAFGTVDELNSALGLVLAGDVPDEMVEPLRRIQNELFDVGADLSVPWGVTDRLRVEQELIDRLEQLCDEFNADLPELRSFVLPGGTETAARLHVARTICRRAERDVLLRLAGRRSQSAGAGLPEPALRPALHPRPRGERGSRSRRTTVEAWELALALAGSFVAGYVGSMLGLVLGTLRLPLIVALTGSPLAAAGTNIAISAASAGAGAIRHARESRVDWRVVAWMAPPSVAGAILGALVAGDVSERLLYAAIAAVLVWSGIDLALRPVQPRTRERLRLWPAVTGGFGIGALGGAVGVILGTLRMPALVRGVGMDVKRAAGTNLVVGFLLGVAGFATHAGALGVDWPILLAGLAGAIPGGWLGAKATGRIDENALRLALGAVLVVVGVAFAVQALRN